jgi:type VI protein secretion system component Hcp
MTERDDSGKETGSDEQHAGHRQFMKFGGLAAAGLLGSTGLGRAVETNALATGPAAAAVDGLTIGETVDVYLRYGDSKIQGESPTANLGGVDLTGTSDLWGIDWMAGDFGDSRRPGRQVISDVVVVKRVDSASVQLYDRYHTNDPLQDPHIEFFRMNLQDGTMEHYYRLELSTTRIFGIALTTMPAEGAVHHFERISLAPETVTVVDVLNDVQITLAGPGET